MTRHFHHRKRSRGGSRWRLVILILGILGSTLLAAASIGHKDDGRKWAFTTKTMGTQATVTLFGDDSTAAAGFAWEAHQEFSRIDSLMSNWTTRSEVARINRTADTADVIVQAEVAGVIDEGLATSRDSDGAFDITVEPLVRLWGFLGGPKRVPDSSEVQDALSRVGWRRVTFDPAERRLRLGAPGMRIDLGGIAKGYAVDAAANVLRRRSVRTALVDISGNMTALGAPEGTVGWSVGVRDPRDRVPYLGRLLLKDESISTSGKYEQFLSEGGRTFGHIMDPRTGWPSDALIAVTVVAPTAMHADAWSTALFVMGVENARALVDRRDDVDAMFISPGAAYDTLWVESSLVPRFHVEEKTAHFLVVRAF